MNFGDIARKRLSFLAILISALALAASPQAALASAAAPAVSAEAPNVADETMPAAEAAEGSTVEAAPGADAYTPLGPEWIKGQPVDGAIDFQPQYSPSGEYAYNMHTYILIPTITVVSLLVLFLLMYVMIRFRRGRNPVPSKTSHNTLIEIIWTVIPVLILVIIAVPSIILLRQQYEAPPEDALTIKATGYQWYWGYSYPDNGDFEVISNMMPEEEARAKGFPGQLEVDNRMVVPAGEWLRIQVTGSDVIHAFGIPSLWFKIDAVPGRLNEKKLFVNEPGIYYGQCMELCGARHGYMPIAIEALPRPQFEAWVRAQGGTVGGDTAAPSLPGLQQPESAIEGAPGAGTPPTGETAPGTDAPTV
jgi:cytochrome c oxidase subunit II